MSTNILKISPSFCKYIEDETEQLLSISSPEFFYWCWHDIWNAVLVKGAYQKSLFLHLLITARTYQTLNTANAGLKKQLLSTISLVLLLSSLASKLFSHFFYLHRLKSIKIIKYCIKYAGKLWSTCSVTVQINGFAFYLCEVWTVFSLYLSILKLLGFLRNIPE